MTGITTYLTIAMIVAVVIVVYDRKVWGSQEIEEEVINGMIAILAGLIWPVVILAVVVVLVGRGIARLI